MICDQGGNAHTIVSNVASGEVRICHRRDGVSADEFREAGLQLGVEDISLAGHVVKERK